ncbi:MAG: polyprenyl synthetase family protein [Kiritimatiellia bacterium]
MNDLEDRVLEKDEEKELMEARLRMVEDALDAVLPKAAARPGVLSAALRWAVEGGGKRIRPLICLAAAEAVGGRAEDALMPACAIELLHTYTLVHDDLPAMDNDTERRGKASVWAKFGEANAILAGDALQALAFQTAARAPRNVPEIVSELGRRGMGVVMGQVEDLVHAPGAVDFVYEHKTADLFMAAACMGALAGGGTPEQVDRLRVFALNLGLAFQYEDDLLDGDSPYSREETEGRIQSLTAAAVEALKGLPGETAFLARFAQRLVSRKV